ncbi:uncharacterized protein ACLA_061150 [Aspergillus clavatus NRRL 1]|uniref:Uncharacterized protein n=1 Tax=Aspergillus clavatus (strain ATCC 1007 / CBS 513.65 / DSM 816 / NCTC 3887 / NRRL 1 / QM 1276 / 107) TaxID=344612 RepID=A1CC97_ASPCL|nr:uncharacterized protein ACLA_061150 [Aspergillus clavatus NRRL 1]EAW12154.1 hypothetical protein ACLA_061150 [Aspergillus clavatus NRRL 1]
MASLSAQMDMDTVNRADGWKIEQGMAGDKSSRCWIKEAIAAVGDRGKLFARESGWKGYVEWEKYPEKKAQAQTIDIPNLQLGSLIFFSIFQKKNIIFLEDIFI